MSIGDLKGRGNLGNNFPYQLGSLQLLGAIYDVLSGGGSSVLVAYDDQVVEGKESDGALALTVPVDATYATFVVEGGATLVDSNKVCRIWYSGTAASATDGQPFADGGVFDIEGRANLVQVSIFFIEDIDSKIHVQYFK